MRFLYIVTTGTNDPTTASIPLHMAANGSVEVGQDVVVLFGELSNMTMYNETCTLGGMNN